MDRQESLQPNYEQTNRFLYLARRLSARIAITIFFAAILYTIGNAGLFPYTGDGHYTEELTLKGWVVLMHSSLTTLIHRLFYTLLQPFGWRAWHAISLSSAVAGGIAIQVLFALRKNPIFLPVNLFSGSFLVFAGEVESYAWVNLFLLLTFLATERFLEGKWPFWPSALFLFTASLFHMLALFYLPALFWILRKNKTIQPWEFALPFLGFMILAFTILLSFPHEGLDLDLSRFTPLFQINRKGQLFTFFSLAHWELLSYFHWKSSFLQILPLEIPLLIMFHKQYNTPFKQFLLLCSICGLLWTTFWHPDLGRLDWDLFSQAFIPIHVLLGLILGETFIKSRNNSKQENPAQLRQKTVRSLDTQPHFWE